MPGNFFSYLPPTPPAEPERESWRPPPWLQAPDDELPAVLAMPRIIARTDQVVLTTSVVEVFSVGVRIPIESLVRRRDETLYDWQRKLVDRHPLESSSTDGLRLGVELADGTRLGADLEPFPMLPPSEEPDAPVLVNHGGGGGGGHDRWNLTHRLWLWPLPPSGDLDVVAEWRAFGILESRITLDASALRAAAGEVQGLWADEIGRPGNR